MILKHHPFVVGQKGRCSARHHVLSRRCHLCLHLSVERRAVREAAAARRRVAPRERVPLAGVERGLDDLVSYQKTETVGDALRPDGASSAAATTSCHTRKKREETN